VGYLVPRISEGGQEENRRFALREAHLDRLRPALQTISKVLFNVSESLERDGYSTDVESGVVRPGNYEGMWYPGDPLADDLPNHFKAYAEGRDELRKVLPEHDKRYWEFHRKVETVAFGASVSPARETAYQAVQKCTGKSVEFRIDQRLEGIAYIEEGRNRIPIIDRPAAEKAVEFFDAFPPTPELKASCDALARDTAAVDEKVVKLAKELRTLAEGSSLPGDCPLLKLE
jgi:hypothetical protein